MVHENRCNPFHCKKIRKNSTYTNRQKRQPRYMGYHLQHIDINSLKIMYLATVKLGSDHAGWFPRCRGSGGATCVWPKSSRSVYKATRHVSRASGIATRLAMA